MFSMPLIYNWTFCLKSTATTQPDVKFVNSTLHSLTLTWAGVSAADVTSFTVSWSHVPSGARGSHTLGRDSFLFTISGLASNTGYKVLVEATGPLGKMNSSAVTFYTAPKCKNTQLHLVCILKLWVIFSRFPHIAPSQIGIAMLSGRILKVSWQPATDAKEHSTVEVQTQFGKVSQSDNASSTSAMISISGLPMYAAGVVTVLAKNPSAMSKITTIQIRTVTIDTNGESWGILQIIHGIFIIISHTCTFVDIRLDSVGISGIWSAVYI